MKKTIYNITDLVYPTSQVRLNSVPTGHGRSTETATAPQPPSGAKVAEARHQATGCVTEAAGSVRSQPCDNPPATATVEAAAMSSAPPASGAIRAEDIVIDQTDMAWSGSVHCM